MPTEVAIHAASAATIDRFADALWIEEGLAANTLAAYRRDLTLLAGWLARIDGAGVAYSSVSFCAATTFL